MASGSSGRGGSGSKGFDFASDDVLCSYDDFGNQETANGKHTDPVSGTNSGKDFRESRMGRSAYLPVYNQQDESLGQEVITTVEKTMKKYADNLLRFLEGISARLSQLELYCYNLEKSIGEMRTDLNRENSEADTKLRSLEKHLQEVHRSIQILRDKQELADTQKELAKLQLHKESSTVSQPQHKEEGHPASSSDLRKLDNMPELANQQLALALPHQVNPPTSLPTRSMEPHQPMPPSQSAPQNVHVQAQPRTYYNQQNQLPSSPLQAHQLPQDQYIPADPQYQRPQLQVSQPPPQPPLQSHVVQPQPVQSFPSYQQQWSQQYPPQVVQQSQPPSQQSQNNPQTTPIYTPYQPSQPANSIPEPFSGNTPVQITFPGIQQTGVGRPELVGYSYGGSGRSTAQQQPPSQHKMQQRSQPQAHTYGPPLSDSAYTVTGSQPTQPPRQGYGGYDGEGGRAHGLPPHFAQGGYPPSHASPPLANASSIRQSNVSPMMRGHPYSDMVEKAVSMGYGADFVLSVIRGMEESGQPMDFNSLLDRLDMHSSGSSHRSW